MLHQQLPAAPARRQRPAVPGDDADGDQAAATTGDQGRDEPALGAEGEAEGGVFDVATGDDPTVVTQPGGSLKQMQVFLSGPSEFKVIEIDDRGRVNLSRREAIRDLAKGQADAGESGSGSPA